MYPDSTDVTPCISSNTASKHQKQPPPRVTVSILPLYQRRSVSALVQKFCQRGIKARRIFHHQEVPHALPRFVAAQLGKRLAQPLLIIRASWGRVHNDQ